MLHLLLVSTRMMIPRMARFDSTQELISFQDQNNTKKSPKTVLISLHRLDLLNDFDKVIGIRDGKIFFNIKRNNLKKIHLDKIY